MYEMVLEGEKHVLQAKDNLVTKHINMYYRSKIIW